MTNEEKQLLLKDLCGRLPYGIKVCVDGCICTLLDIDTEMGDRLNGETFHIAGFNKPNGSYSFCAISEVKPYLRPLSSMTEDEENELVTICVRGGYKDSVFKSYLADDWLNKKMFDYRGLIPMGLALEAPEDMYKEE